jgi:hypothetical protein
MKERAVDRAAETDLRRRRAVVSRAEVGRLAAAPRCRPSRPRSVWSAARGHGGALLPLPLLPGRERLRSRFPRERPPCDGRYNQRCRAPSPTEWTQTPSDRTDPQTRGSTTGAILRRKAVSTEGRGPSATPGLRGAPHREDPRPALGPQRMFVIPCSSATRDLVSMAGSRSRPTASSNRWASRTVREKRRDADDQARPVDGIATITGATRRRLRPQLTHERAVRDQPGAAPDRFLCQLNP